MSDYDNTNRGAIFVNEKKATENHPDRTGSINIEGVEYFLDGWIKKSKTGVPFMSLSVKRKEKQPKAAAPTAMAQRQAAKHSTPAQFEDQDIPF